jgi:DNA replication protein DnaC
MITIKQSFEELGLNGMQTVLEQLIEEGKELDENQINLLHRLLTAEAESRKRKRTETLIRRAKFRYQSSMGSVHTGVARNLEKDFLDRLGTGRWIKQGQNLLMAPRPHWPHHWSRQKLPCKRTGISSLRAWNESIVF